MRIEPKAAFYNEDTGAVQPWKDIEVTDSVGNALVSEGLAIAIAEGGGGGGGDFSTAQVTLICNASDEVSVNLALLEEAEPPFVPNPQTNAYLSLNNGNELTVTAILYKGYCDCSFDGASALSGEGDVTIINNWDAKITGDCTITIS